MKDSSSITELQLVLIVVFFSFPFFNPLFSYNTDFPFLSARVWYWPVCYRCLGIRYRGPKKYAVPENFTGKSAFLYSIPVAYALSPLGAYALLCCKVSDDIYSFLAYLVAVIDPTDDCCFWPLVCISSRIIMSLVPFIQIFASDRLIPSCSFLSHLPSISQEKNNLPFPELFLPLLPLSNYFCRYCFSHGSEKPAFLLVFALTLPCLSYPGSLNGFCNRQYSQIGLMPAYFSAAICMNGMSSMWYLLLE